MKINPMSSMALSICKISFIKAWSHRHRQTAHSCSILFLWVLSLWCSCFSLSPTCCYLFEVRKNIDLRSRGPIVQLSIVCFNTFCIFLLSSQTSQWLLLCWYLTSAQHKSSQGLGHVAQCLFYVRSASLSLMSLPSDKKREKKIQRRV